MTDTEPKRECPDGAVLSVKGEHFPCDMMDHMDASCDTHDGWAHTNGKAEAVWK